MIEELRIKRADIDKIVLYGGRSRHTVKQVYDSLADKPDYIINGLMYDTISGISVADTIVDGRLINGGNYTDKGIGINDNDLMQSTTTAAKLAAATSLLGGSPSLVWSGKVDIDAAGFSEWFIKKGLSDRLAMGFNAEEVIFYFPQAKMTVEKIAGIMRQKGCRTAINLDGGGSRMVVKIENGELQKLNQPTENRANSTWILIYLKNGGSKMLKVMLDAGHGQSDPGAVGPTGLKEKDAALSIVKKVGELLTAHNVETSYTRTGDYRLVDSGTKGQDLSARANKANAAKVDYFVSVHCNSAVNVAANGIETYIIAKGGQAEQLANKVQMELIAATGRADRGVKTANYAVLRETDMPAILTEVCFICNKEEEKLLRNAEFLDKAAEAIAKGIAEYLGIVWRVPDDDWQAIAIKEVCECFRLDEALWLSKKEQPATIGELFGIINKVRS